VVERMAKVDADRDTARQQASSAREDAAKLSGQVEALQTQVDSLMQALAARTASVAEAKPIAKK